MSLLLALLGPAPTNVTLAATEAADTFSGAIASGDVLALAATEAADTAAFAVGATPQPGSSVADDHDYYRTRRARQQKRAAEEAAHKAEVQRWLESLRAKPVIEPAVLKSAPPRVVAAEPPPPPPPPPVEVALSATEGADTARGGLVEGGNIAFRASEAPDRARMRAAFNKRELARRRLSSFAEAENLSDLPEVQAVLQSLAIPTGDRIEKAARAYRISKAASAYKKAA